MDHTLVDGMKDLRFALHHPRDEGEVLALNNPWEGQFCDYATILNVGEKLGFTKGGGQDW